MLEIPVLLVSADPEAESLLQRLRAPKPSVLARKRLIKTNPPVGKKRGKGRCEADPKNVTVSDRLKEYSEETLCLAVATFSVHRVARLFL